MTPIMDDPETGEPDDDQPGREDTTPADPAQVEALADRILRGLGLDLKAAARDAGETIEADISGPDHGYLLERRGEGLNALQYLLNRIIYRGHRGKRIHVDSNGFRRLREEEVVEIARRGAEKAKARGEEVLLGLLNPYERRLVHLALAEVGGVLTESRGDGFLKRVAIRPSGGITPDEGERGS
jgi:spoIIIJ-associated protein